MKSNSLKPKVLFIGHDATRTGAPIVLLHLLKWLKNNTALQFEILLLSDGPLKPDFEQLGTTYLLKDLYIKPTYTNRIKKKLLHITIDDEYKRIVQRLAAKEYDVIYGNTIATLRWLKLFKEEHSLKTICCIHELTGILNYFFADEYIQENLPRMDRVIAVSNAVRENLITNLNIPANKIRLHYAFIDTNIQPQVNSDFKPGLSIEQGEFIVGLAGTPSWRKGTDLIIPVVTHLATQYPEFKFKFIWLGANLEDDYIKQLIDEAQKHGVADKIIFIPPKTDPLNYINLFDVFVLLSREDPFPLVVLEAAFLKKPIIAFENSGGIPELIEQGAGLLAPYLDTRKVADLIYELSQNKKQADRLAHTANDLVVTKYSSEVVAPAIYDLIKELAS